MKKLRIVLLLVFMCPTLSADIAVTPTYVPRSQGRDKMRTLVNSLGWGYTDRYAAEGWYGNFSSGIGYTQSFRNNTISECLFGTDISCNACDMIIVQGSRVTDRNERAWLADYFYLNCEYEGNFSFKPRIQNVLMDFDVYLGLDEIIQGSYLRLYGPVVWTKWRTNFCVTDQSNSNTTACRGGYFTPNGTETLLTSLGNYFSGDAPETTENIIFHPLFFAQMPNYDETKWGFAELRVELGYNFVQKENSHVGMNIQMAVPTGGKRKAKYVFDPVVGNGDHWEFGGGLTAHYMFCKSEHDGVIAGWFIDLSITHIFKSIEERTFDLCGKPNSRYMLAAKFSDSIQNNLAGSNLPDTSSATSMNVTAPSAQFANEYSPVANLTTIGINIKNMIQVDWVIMLHFGWHNFSLDFGYNLWVRTCENILNSRGDNDFSALSTMPTLFEESQDDTWALKGDANMFGYATLATGGLALNQAVALSATQNNATIHEGTNSSASGEDPELRNLGIDNPRYAYADSNAAQQQLNFAPDRLILEENHIKTSINPNFINFENIEFQPTRGLSNKLFLNVSYHLDDQRFLPYIGIGAFVELGQNKKINIIQPTTEVSFFDTFSGECITCSLTQWAIWVKAGIAFE